MGEYLFGFLLLMCWEQGLQIWLILSNFGEMWWIRSPSISKKLTLFIKNQHCSMKIGTVHRKIGEKSDSATSDFLHSVEFLNTGWEMVPLQYKADCSGRMAVSYSCPCYVSFFSFSCPLWFEQ
jgi:hypothetical protein